MYKSCIEKLIFIPMKKRILITGSAGFIGFHTALAAAKRGDFVIGCDDFNAYYDPDLKRKRAALLLKEGITTLPLDICDTDSLAELLKTHNITDVLHLAAQAGVRHALTHAEEFVHSNLKGFVSLFEALKSMPHIQCVYASSASVYGHNKKAPFSEKDSTDAPAGLYGATKKCNEILAYSYHELFGIASTALRFFTVYGPYGRPDMAYFSFAKNILDNKPIHVYGEGKPRRDFTYIDDIVTGILAAIDLRAPYEIFNLGATEPHSVLELVSLLEELTGKKAQLHFEPLPGGDVPLTFADIEKSSLLLGFKPTVSLREGLGKFLAWYDSYYTVSTH